jgi:hypothetical protein
MSSGTCQNFCGSGRRNRAGSIVVKVRPALLTRICGCAQPLLRHRYDTVAFGRPAQIGYQRQDASWEIGADGRRLDLCNIRVDVTDREDRVPLAHETESHRPAKPAQPAGDDRDPSFHRSLPVFGPRCRV